MPLLIDALGIGVDGVLRYPLQVGNLLLDFPLGEQLQDLPFPLGELVCPPEFLGMGDDCTVTAAPAL